MLSTLGWFVSLRCCMLYDSDQSELVLQNEINQNLLLEIRLKIHYIGEAENTAK